MKGWVGLVVGSNNCIDVSHCRILSRDKTEWRLISATLCGWRRCFVANLWLMTRIREEEDCIEYRLLTYYAACILNSIFMCHRVLVERVVLFVVHYNQWWVWVGKNSVSGSACTAACWTWHGNHTYLFLVFLSIYYACAWPEWSVETLFFFCLFVCPSSVRLFVCPFVAFVAKRMNTKRWERINRFQCKLAEVVHTGQGYETVDVWGQEVKGEDRRWSRSNKSLPARYLESHLTIFNRTR